MGFWLADLKPQLLAIRTQEASSQAASSNLISISARLGPRVAGKTWAGVETNKRELNVEEPLIEPGGVAVSQREYRLQKAQGTFCQT